MQQVRLVIFDMDGVLVDVESSWGWIHTHYGIDNWRTVRAYLGNEIDENEFMNRDIALWKEKGMGEHELYEILANVPLMPGARECLRVLRHHGVPTAIVSAGLDVLAERIAQELGIDYVIANGIEIQGGRLTGRGILRVSPRAKDGPIKTLCQELQIPRERVVSVGNSHFDIRMFHVTGKGIAFNPSDQDTQTAADVVITTKDLNLILPHIGITQ
jgi:phosphoserine phosphatase